MYMKHNITYILILIYKKKITDDLEKVYMNVHKYV